MITTRAPDGANNTEQEIELKPLSNDKNKETITKDEMPLKCKGSRHPNSGDFFDIFDRKNYLQSIFGGFLLLKK